MGREEKKTNKQTNKSLVAWRTLENELKIKAKAAVEAGNANELKNLNESYLQLKKIVQLFN